MVCIAQHHRDRFPPAQFLDRIDIDARLDQSGRKGMPQIMEAEPRDPRLSHRRIERPQQIARLPWVVRPIDEHRLRAVRPHRGAGLQDFHRRVIHRQRIPRAILLLQDRERPSRPLPHALRRAFAVHASHDLYPCLQFASPLTDEESKYACPPRTIAYTHPE